MFLIGVDSISSLQEYMEITTNETIIHCSVSSVSKKFFLIIQGLEIIFYLKTKNVQIALSKKASFMNMAQLSSLPFRKSRRKYRLLPPGFHKGSQTVGYLLTEIFFTQPFLVFLFP